MRRRRAASPRRPPRDPKKVGHFAGHRTWWRAPIRPAQLPLHTVSTCSSCRNGHGHCAMSTRRLRCGPPCLARHIHPSRNHAACRLRSSCLRPVRRNAHRRACRTRAVTDRFARDQRANDTVRSLKTARACRHPQPAPLIYSYNSLFVIAHSHTESSRLSCRRHCRTCAVNAAAQPLNRSYTQAAIRCHRTGAARLLRRRCCLWRTSAASCERPQLATLTRLTRTPASTCGRAGFPMRLRARYRAVARHGRDGHAGVRQ